MTNRIAVSSAEFIRNIGYWQSEALRQPIAITHHGRERLVLAAPDAVHAEGAAQSEAVLAALRADFASVLENLDEGFLLVDAQLHIVSSNATAEAFTGRTRDQLRGAQVFDVLPQPLGSILGDRLQRVIRSRKQESVDAGSFDGRAISMNVFPMAKGAAALFTNTTEQQHLRRELEQSAALDAAVRRHPQAAAMRLDSRARIAAIDEHFCVWSGFSGADVLGHRFIDLISPPHRREAGEAIEGVLREALGRDIALTLLGKRGEEMRGVLSLAPIVVDSVAHGAQALWVPTQDDADERQHAA
ncbi:PAS domain-containing protein [Terricaulis silvestris]|uniref:Sensory histidine kinase AtoS n=1 Tax=Terricaulis silvestris TaxID=2686094 RepID=A0A6I6MGL2_9CAUL|nr:PAS domain-containing protein [Terricaulis silvestris]QGZ93835.1 sensory histidine kinase AtoS [Terricaulis silvestris]